MTKLPLPRTQCQIDAAAKYETASEDCALFSSLECLKCENCIYAELILLAAPTLDDPMASLNTQGWLKGLHSPN